MKMKMLLAHAAAFSLVSGSAFAVGIQNTDPNQVAVDVSSGSISQTVILQPGERYNVQGDTSFSAGGKTLNAKDNEVLIIKGGSVVNPRDSKQLKAAVAAKVDTDLVPADAVPDDADIASTPSHRDQDEGKGGKAPHAKKAPHFKPNPNKAAKARLNQGGGGKKKKGKGGDGNEGNT